MNTDITINALDLNCITTRLMQPGSGKSWNRERAEAAELEYRRFLLLIKKFPHEQAAPTADVDTFWHHHILDTRKYAADCEQVFGYFLHHFPSLGLGEDDIAVARDAGERMKELYQQTFGTRAYGATAWCATSDRSDPNCAIGPGDPYGEVALTRGCCCAERPPTTCAATCASSRGASTNVPGAFNPGRDRCTPGIGATTVVYAPDLLGDARAECWSNKGARHQSTASCAAHWPNVAGSSHRPTKSLSRSAGARRHPNWRRISSGGGGGRRACSRAIM